MTKTPDTTNTDQDDVVVSSRVRLARNLAGFPFVNRADPSQCREIVSMVKSLELAPEIGTTWIDMAEASATEQHVLLERHLVSRQFVAADGPRGVAITQDRTLSIMVNEEDHLRIQVLLPGSRLRNAWNQVNEVDRRLERTAELAIHPRWGYLTACPTNVGTAIRFSIMAHLPALRLTNEIERLRRAANSLNLAVRGFYGEGSESSGDFYQISNQLTLGLSEEDLLDTFVDTVVPKVVGYERLAREMLLERNRILLEDRVHRAFGILSAARLLSIEEGMKHLSRIRLGISLGILNDVSLDVVRRLFLEMQPAHLRVTHGTGASAEPVIEDLDDEWIRECRATLVRRTLCGAS